MTKDDYKLFCETWTSIADVTVSSKIITDSALFFIFNSLSAYSIGDIMRACGIHVMKSKYMCTISDIVEIIEGDKTITADTAWTIIFNAITSVGQYGTIDLSYCDNAYAIAYAVEMQGWVNICCAEEKDMKWIEKRFKEHFNYAMKKEIKNVCCIQSGIHDVTNVGKGYDKQLPIPLSDITMLEITRKDDINNIPAIDFIDKKLSM